MPSLFPQLRGCLLASADGWTASFVTVLSECESAGHLQEGLSPALLPGLVVPGSTWKAWQIERSSELTVWLWVREAGPHPGATLTALCRAETRTWTLSWCFHAVISLLFGTR
jgi:hypothetical protein